MRIKRGLGIAAGFSGIAVLSITAVQAEAAVAAAVAGNGAVLTQPTATVLSTQRTPSGWPIRAAQRLQWLQPFT